MALSALDDRSKAPEARQLAQVLGRSSGLWVTLAGDLRSRFDPLDEKWGFSGAKYGWSLSLKYKQRTILYLIPQHKHFLVAFVLGPKAIDAARRSALPTAVVQAIDSARQYPEGRGVRLPVRNRKDLAAVEQLVAIKMAN